MTKVEDALPSSRQFCAIGCDRREPDTRSDLLFLLVRQHPGTEKSAVTAAIHFTVAGRYVGGGKPCSDRGAR